MRGGSRRVPVLIPRNVPLELRRPGTRAPWRNVLHAHRSAVRARGFRVSVQGFQSRSGRCVTRVTLARLRSQLTQLSVIRQAHSGRPAFDTAVSHAVLLRIARSELGATFRLRRAERVLAFSKQDANSPGF